MAHVPAHHGSLELSLLHLRLLSTAALGACLLVGAGASVSAQAAATTESEFARRHYAKKTFFIRMRDDVALFTVAYVPADASPAKPYPIVLTRTPFSVGRQDSVFASTIAPDPFMLHDGYIYVQQEVRGRYQSEGTFENVRPLLPDSAKDRSARAADESTDAYDTIAWLLEHLDGNNGRVGLHGVSYGGYYAGLAARSRHPAIAAISLQAPVADFYFEDFRRNGALTLGSFYAYPVFGVPREAPGASHWWLPAFQRVAANGMADDYNFLLGLGPLHTITERYYADNTWWREVVAHPDYDSFWRARALPTQLHDITAPTLVVGGWFDAENLYGTLAVYRAMRTQNPRTEVALAIGPFGHRGWSARDVVHTVHGNLYFGDSVETTIQRDVEAAFFRAHLKGDGTVLPRGAMMFDTGTRRWRHSSQWPDSTTVQRNLYLREDGSLSRSPSATTGTFLEYVSDPRKPVPTRCAGPTIEDGTLFHYMSDDQRCFSSRPDVVVFQSDVLTDDLTLAGPLSAMLRVSTTGTDADFVVKLIDVYPPDEPNHEYQRDTTARLGRYQQLVRGDIMRGRYRRSFSTPLPFQTNVRVDVDVPMLDVLHTFRKGHRIMVQVQGSWFPLYDRNPQRFVPSIYAAGDGDFIVARNRIWTSGVAGSRLRVTVLR